MNNSAESVRRGLACAGLEEPSHNLKQLINYSHKVKHDQRALYQVSSDEKLREQAKGEAHLRKQPYRQRM